MWQSYFEMMHVVPTCPSPTPSLTSSPDSPISFEFDLNLLPSSDCSDFVGNLDLPLPLSSLTDPFQEVPSPTASFSQLETNLQSPMMFSPVNGDKTQLYNWLEPSTSSPISLPPSSPYSPAGRPNRLSSTDSGLMTEGSSVSSIQDSLMELNELRSQFKLEQVSGPPPPYVMPHGQIVPKTEPQSSVDHPLLRQVLEDFSFDQKFAPKFEDNDFQVKSELDDSLSEVKLNPVISLAMEQVKKDIETTCQILHISQDPSRWSRNDVMRWMEWTMQTFNLEPVTPIQEWVTEGQFMVQMTEQQFKEKIPQGGDLMYAQLDVWRSTANCQQDEAVVVPQMQPETRNSVYDPSISINDLMSMMVEEEAHQSGTQNFDSELTSRNDHLLSPPPYPSERTNPSTDFQMEDEDDDASSERDFGQPSVAATIQTPPTPNRSSTNIHLWQFVKELLNEPHLHSGCIHWVDKDKGIFKIVDSVRVAHLWGKRKNRPAMNYDKLSRSLRQYYKKGIMKKTERTQRLVYQFCSPYHH